MNEKPTKTKHIWRLLSKQHNTVEYLIFTHVLQAKRLSFKVLMVIPQVEGKQSSPRHFFEDFTPLSRNRGRGSCQTTLGYVCDEKILLADWSTVYGWNSFSKITKLEQDIGGEEKLDGHDETKNDLLKYMITLQKVWKLTANVLGINTVKIYKIF